MKNGIMVVLVNPYHVKKSKELDDNTQTKNDPKDALTIARLVRDGRFSKVYIPDGVYGELRALSNTRSRSKNDMSAILNIINAILDEYFPEYISVFKDITGKASRQILAHHPFPQDLQKLGVEGITEEFRKVMKRTVGRKRAEALYNVACQSIGLPSNEVIKMRLAGCLEQLSLLTEQVAQLETYMEKQLKATGISDYILSIKGVGIVTAAGILGEMGDPSRFTSWKQVRKLAGLNLVEDSSGKHQGKKIVSKRGRPSLRSYLYQVALVLVSKNIEFKQIYTYLIHRKENPLKRKQALVVVMTKFIRVFLTLIWRRETFDPKKVMGAKRKAQILIAA
jgi:transposase